MRILCLHGMGTNNQIFQSQTAALRSELGGPDIHTFEFVEGNVKTPAAPGVSAVFSQVTEFFAYYDLGDPVSILAAIEDLSMYVNEEGPFDGVMGFSQGAALAAMLLARDPSSPPFSFAIFLCAGVPFCERGLRKGTIRFLDSASDGELLRIPTAHILGARDKDLAASLALGRLCFTKLRVMYDHGAGHEVPVNPKGVTGAMARCVEDVISKATFLQ